MRRPDVKPTPPTAAAVRDALARLVEQGAAVDRLSDGRYIVTPAGGLDRLMADRSAVVDLAAQFQHPAAH